LFILVVLVTNLAIARAENTGLAFLRLLAGVYPLSPSFSRRERQWYSSKVTTNDTQAPQYSKDEHKAQGMDGLSLHEHEPYI
jgi:hypothetical protein